MITRALIEEQLHRHYIKSSIAFYTLLWSSDEMEMDANIMISIMDDQDSIIVWFSNKKTDEIVYEYRGSFENYPLADIAPVTIVTAALESPAGKLSYTAKRFIQQILEECQVISSYIIHNDDEADEALVCIKEHGFDLLGQFMIPGYIENYVQAYIRIQTYRSNQSTWLISDKSTTGYVTAYVHDTLTTTSIYFVSFEIYENDVSLDSLDGCTYMETILEGMLSRYTGVKQLQDLERIYRKFKITEIVNSL